MEEDYLPNPFEMISDIENTESDKIVNKELEHLNILANSNGWKLVEDFIQSLKVSIVYSAKVKAQEESLESYGAKRLSADAIEDTLDRIIEFVNSAKQTYDENVNK